MASTVEAPSERERARARVGTVDEVDEMLDVILSAFDRWPAVAVDVPARDHLLWKLQRPYPGIEKLHVVLELDGRVIGTNIALHREALLGGERIRARGGGDTAIHPDFQGRGLYRPVSDASDTNPDGSELTVEFSLNPAMLHINDRKGSRDLGNPLRVLVYPLSARRTAACYQDRIPGGRALGVVAAGFALASGWNRLRNRSAVPAPPRGCAIQTWAEFDERIDAFADEASRRFDFIFTRERAFLNWRYCDRRGGDFVVRGATAGDEVLGYAVYRLEGERAYIADLLALPGRSDVVRALVEDVQQGARAKGAATLICWMTQAHEYARVIKGLGFIDARRQTGLAWRPMRDGVPHVALLADPHARIHVTLGDSDLI